MPNTLQTTLNWATAYIQNQPLSNNTGFEPAASIASIVRNSILNAPMTWVWNRFEDSSVVTTLTDQDYTVNLANFGFLEKVSLTDSTGNTQELKDILNTTSLSKNTVPQRPSAVSVISNVPGVSIKIRFNTTPDKIYTVNLTYQGIASQFGPFVISSAAPTGGNTTYFGIFSPASFPVGSVATIDGFSTSFGVSGITSVANSVGPYTTYTGVFTAAYFPAGTQVTISGFTNAGNNGVFKIVSVNGTTLVVVSQSGIAETATATAIGAVISPNNGTFSVLSSTNTHLVLANPNGAAEIPPTGSATAVNGSWAPIPDQYSDVYNNLFLSEAFQTANDDAEAARYRQRGVAALLSKAEGLTQTQINIFRQQWLARDSEQMANTLRTQQGSQARGV
jgi:hypothetical protein